MSPSVVGSWRIIEMELWDREALDLLGPAAMEISADGSGGFRFIAVEGDVDGRLSERDGRSAIEFSWVGTDDGHEVSGRGWALNEADGTLTGRLYFHRGDDSGFRASRANVN